MALKPPGRVNRSLKQRVPVAPQNGDRPTKQPETPINCLYRCTGSIKVKSKPQ